MNTQQHTFEEYGGDDVGASGQVQGSGPPASEAQPAKDHGASAGAAGQAAWPDDGLLPERPKAASLKLDGAEMPDQFVALWKKAIAHGGLLLAHLATAQDGPAQVEQLEETSIEEINARYDLELHIDRTVHGITLVAGNQSMLDRLWVVSNTEPDKILRRAALVDVIHPQSTSESERLNIAVGQCAVIDPYAGVDVRIVVFPGA
jgi:hypothetical protein